MVHRIKKCWNVERYFICLEWEVSSTGEEQENKMSQIPSEQLLLVRLQSIRRGTVVAGAAEGVSKELKRPAGLVTRPITSPAPGRLRQKEKT